MRKIVMLGFITTLCIAMNDQKEAMDNQKEVKLLFKANRSYEEIALATFQPSHQNLDCFQSSLIKGIRYGYNAIPLVTILCIGPLAYYYTGEVKSLCAGIPFLAGLIYYPWKEHNYNGIIYSNKIAKKILPADFTFHKLNCLDTIGQIQQEQQKKFEAKHKSIK